MALTKGKSELLKIFEERFDAFESSLNGEASSKIHENRKQAFKLLKTQDFPGRKTEEYKYTPITKTLEKELLGNYLFRKNMRQAKNWHIWEMNIYSRSFTAKDHLPGLKGISLLYSFLNRI